MEGQTPDHAEGVAYVPFWEFLKLVAFVTDTFYSVSVIIQGALKSRVRGGGFVLFL